jgi:hypothetical protein
MARIFEFVWRGVYIAKDIPYVCTRVYIKQKMWEFKAFLTPFILTIHQLAIFDKPIELWMCPVD